MRRHPRIRRLTKWSGTFVCAAILLVWAANAFQDMRWFFGQWILYLERGDVWLSSGDPLIRPRTGWEATRIREVPEFFAGSLPLVHVGDPNTGTVKYLIRIPLWLPFVIMLVPPAYLIWRDWRTVGEKGDRPHDG